MPERGDLGDRSYSPSTIRAVGEKVVEPRRQMRRLADAAAAIELGFPWFGLIGMPLNGAHNSARDGAKQSMLAGRDQLVTWRKNLYTAANTYAQANEHSTVRET